jgi:uncharacterized protein
MFDIFLLSISILLIVIGLIGCIAPILPGPPLSFLGMVALQATHWGNFSSNTLWVYGGLAIVVTLVDYIFPV